MLRKSFLLTCLALSFRAADGAPVRPFYEPRPASASAQTSAEGVIQKSSGLQYVDLAIGSGRTAAAGNTISVHYVGTFKDGKKFDSSRDRNMPFEFRLGQGSVNKGFDEGMIGMKEGGKRTLRIPPPLGYGERGVGTVIPPNATLIFEVELLKVK